MVENDGGDEVDVTRYVLEDAATLPKRGIGMLWAANTNRARLAVVRQFEKHLAVVED